MVYGILLLYCIARLNQGNWEEIEFIVQKSSGFLGTLGGTLRGPKYKTAIEIKHLVDILGAYKMPIHRLRKFIIAIEDIEDRKKAAHRWSDHNTALEVRINFTNTTLLPFLTLIVVKDLGSRVLIQGFLCFGSK